MTGDKYGNILLFDPYYQKKPFPQSDIILDLDHPKEFNRIVPWDYFNKETQEIYSLGDIDSREAVLLFNEETKLTRKDD